MKSSCQARGGRPGQARTSCQEARPQKGRTSSLSMSRYYYYYYYYYYYFFFFFFFGLGSSEIARVRSLSSSEPAMNPV